MTNPQTIVAQAEPGDSVVGWKLSDRDRARLLERFVPRYPRTVADHVTLAAKVAADTPLSDRLPAQIVGHVSDGEGLEALVVAIDGTTDRPDGSTYHITWSLADGRRAQESNEVLKRKGWTALGEALPIALEPQHFP